MAIFTLKTSAAQRLRNLPARWQAALHRLSHDRSVPPGTLADLELSPKMQAALRILGEYPDGIVCDDLAVRIYGQRSEWPLPRPPHGATGAILSCLRDRMVIRETLEEGRRFVERLTRAGRRYLQELERNPPPPPPIRTTRATAHAAELRDLRRIRRHALALVQVVGPDPRHASDIIRAYQRLQRALVSTAGTSAP